MGSKAKVAVPGPSTKASSDDISNDELPTADAAAVVQRLLSDPLGRSLVEKTVAILAFERERQLRKDLESELAQLRGATEDRQ